MFSYPIEGIYLRIQGKNHTYLKLMVDKRERERERIILFAIVPNYNYFRFNYMSVSRGLETGIKVFNSTASMPATNNSDI